jgi:LicD family
VTSLHGSQGFDNDILKIFFPKLTEPVKESYIRLIQQLTDGLDAVNVTYFMCGGTLLGSYRHHGFIPWDDDVDLCVKVADQRRIRDAFEDSKLFEDCELYTKKVFWKVYSKKYGSPIQQTPKSNFPWKYPFIDIFFYTEQSNSSFTLDWYDSVITQSRSDIFPLHRRPFVNLKLWAPRDIQTFLINERYTEDTCKTHHWVHNVERSAGRTHSTECRKLWPFFPFVFRLNSSETNTSSSVVTTTVEQLKIGDIDLHTVEVETSAAESSLSRSVTLPIHF